MKHAAIDSNKCVRIYDDDDDDENVDMYPASVKYTSLFVRANHTEYPTFTCKHTFYTCHRKYCSDVNDKHFLAPEGGGGCESVVCALSAYTGHNIAARHDSM